jgi:YNFM family putative membrane transporter
MMTGFQGGSAGTRALNLRTFAVVLAGACAFFGLYATQPLLPMFERIFGVGEVAVSLTVTAGTVGVALAAPWMGALADRIGRRRVILSSAAVLSATTLLSATSPSLPVLILWRFLQGLATPGVFAVTVAYINDEWREEGTGAAMSAYVSGTVLGGFTGRLVAGLAASALGWRSSLLAVGLLCAGGTLAMWLWLPAEHERIAEDSSGVWTAALQHLRNPKLAATYAAGFCVLFTLVATFTYITFHLAAPPWRLHAAALGSLFFVYLVGAMVTQAAGRWIDRYGHRVTLALAVGIGVAGILLTIAPELWLIVIGLALACSGVFISHAAATTYIGAIAHHHRALAVGLYAMFYYVGGSAGAAIPGLLWRFGGWRSCAALIVAVQMATLAFALLFWSKSGPAETPGPTLVPGGLT